MVTSRRCLAEDGQRPVHRYPDIFECATFSFRIQKFLRPHVIGFVSALLFSTLRADSKYLDSRMRVDASHIRKEKVADSKISGYV